MALLLHAWFIRKHTFSYSYMEDKTNLTQPHRLPGGCVPAARHGGGGVTWHDRHLGSATSVCHHTAATTGHTNRTVLLPSGEETVIVITDLNCH